MNSYLINQISQYFDLLKYKLLKFICVKIILYKILKTNDILDYNKSQLK